MHAILQGLASTVLKDVEEKKEGTYTRYRKLVNKEFLRKFDRTNLSKRYLQEFIYGIDHLEELTEFPGFPGDCILTTPDLINLGEQAIRVLTKHENAKGVAVSEAMLEHFQVFYDYTYLATIGKIFRGLRTSGINFTLDKQVRYLGIVHETAYPHISFLVYRPYNQTYRIFIPFLKQRLQ